jgi:PAS domain S-box-containing protein
MNTRVAVALWTLALLSAAGTVALVFTSDHEESPAAQATLLTAVGLAFVGAGLIARYRRAENRTGLLMTLVGFAWFLPALTDSTHAAPFTLGVAVQYVAFGFFAYLILAFPTGRLGTTARKVMVVLAFLITTVGRIAWMLFNDLRADFPGAPKNLLLIEHDTTVSTVIETIIQIVALGLIAGTLALFVRRWRDAAPPLRRGLAPVFVTASLAILLLAGWVAMDAADAPGQDAVWWLLLGAFICVPLAFLLGLLQGRLARSAVGRLVVELGTTPAQGDLRDALARALGDPTLQVAYRVDEDVYVDVDGNHVELPGDGRRATTFVEHDGECVAALVHDASLREDRDLIEAVAAAAGLALENEKRLATVAESEAKQRALLEAMPDLMFRLGRDGTYRDVKGNERQLVLPPSRLIGKKIYDVLPRDQAESIMRCAESVLAGRGRVETVEYQLQVGGPLVRHFEGRMTASGEDEVLLVARDISARKRAERQLRLLQDELRARLDDLQRERDFVRAVVQAAPSFFCLVDPAGRVVRFNRTLEQASGHSDDDSVRGRPFWDVFVPLPEERAEVCRVFDETLRTRSRAEHENHWITAAGDRMLVAWSVTPVLDERGEQCFLVTGTDITARKQAEEEIRRSRARIVEAGDTERRRLERNLHDGAQQRLVSISLFLRLAETKLREEPEGAEQLLATASEELGQALEELRELARGIHPAVLTDRGLGPALEALVSRSPLEVELERPDERFPEPVEAAAYYVVSEALTNVAKYSRASAATVSVARLNSRAVVEVADDGVGGADPARGSGLRGLADRVEALEGQLAVESPPGRGTRIRAEIPCA